MDRRRFLGVVASTGIAATAGCNAIGGSRTLREPTVHTDSPARRSLEWTANGESLGELGVTGTVSPGLVDLSTEVSHPRGTTVTSIALGVWMASPGTETPADVAVVSPVEGDGSPPPSVALYSPDRGRGTTIEVTDLNDLGDETISTLDLLVRPRSETATTLGIDARIDLTSGGALGTDYALDGRLELHFPGLQDQ